MVDAWLRLLQRALHAVRALRAAVPAAPPAIGLNADGCAFRGIRTPGAFGLSRRRLNAPAARRVSQTDNCNLMKDVSLWRHSRDVEDWMGVAGSR